MEAGLIAQIEARAHAKPVTLKEAVTSARTGEDVSYLRVRVEGRFDNAKERYLYALSDGTPGWHVSRCLRRQTGRWRWSTGLVHDGLRSCHFGRKARSTTPSP